MKVNSMWHVVTFLVENPTTIMFMTRFDDPFSSVCANILTYEKSGDVFIIGDFK